MAFLCIAYISAMTVCQTQDITTICVTLCVKGLTTCSHSSSNISSRTRQASTHARTDKKTNLGDSLEEVVVLFFINVIYTTKPEGFVVIQKFPPPLGLLHCLGGCLFLLFLCTAVLSKCVSSSRVSQAGMGKSSQLPKSSLCS